MVLKSSKQVSHKKDKYIDEPIKVKGYYAIILFLALLFLDRLTKVWATNLKESIDLGFMAFAYTTNTGAGFSIFQNQNTLLAWIAVIALGLMIFFYDKFPKSGFILIITGIIGNLIDRVSYGYVIDFIDFKFWPVFNAADAFIFIGVVITIFVWIKEDKNTKKKKVKPRRNRKSRK
ncbi:TPA: signal peptidase II [Candidatus Woesearchaeota archaeon]|nr:signal peptidase II [Candidatus Woesearchaeota archaeon]HIH31537.1 signal peptidase II [Candidatus Woesearchaeota archaeon]HIH54305.1 signal peptidase II [Candidatus Woesearchaeota archaeon]HIJ02505.1 signal peptidase II [Candidatus Woesearchaeota archaeon]HIJ13449.1 signal peptidase II [Candidatus Woesearchaeota archaeon]